MATLTVFTPLYNRINTLKRTYESLKRQTSKDFVWLIIDDGSTDNPYEIIKEWIKINNGFEIKYVYKENGGMHTAHRLDAACHGWHLHAVCGLSVHIPS